MPYSPRFKSTKGTKSPEKVGEVFYILARRYDGLARAVVPHDDLPASPMAPKRFVNRQGTFQCIAIREDADSAAKLLVILSKRVVGIELQLVGDAALAPFERERYQNEAKSQRGGLLSLRKMPE